MGKKSLKSSKKSLISFIIIMCILVIGAMAVYFQVMKRQQMKQDISTPTTETEKLIAKDLDQGYPETPTEVMKLWGRINQCLYNTDMSDEQFDALASQLRTMYSTELAEQNPESSHKKKLKEEISEFQDNKYKIVSYSAESGKNVKYQTLNGKECAYLSLYYFINQRGNYAKTFQDYILVKENERWKILGFQKAETKEVTEEEALVS